MCAIILRYEHKIVDLNNHAFSGLRIHHDCFSIVTEHLIHQKIWHENSIINAETISSALFACYQFFDPQQIRNTAFKLLVFITSSSSTGCLKFDATQISKLSSILAQAKIHYENPEEVNINEVTFTQSDKLS